MKMGMEISTSQGYCVDQMRYSILTMMSAMYCVTQTIIHMIAVVSIPYIYRVFIQNGWQYAHAQDAWVAPIITLAHPACVLPGC